MDGTVRLALELSAQGLVSVEIAGRLGISADAAHESIRRAMGELGARSKLEAVVIADRLGLLNAQSRTVTIPLGSTAPDLARRDRAVIARDVAPAPFTGSAGALVGQGRAFRLQKTSGDSTLPIDVRLTPTGASPLRFGCRRAPR